LAYTGSETSTLAAAGTALLATGAAFTSFAARKQRVAEAAAAEAADPQQ
jgi:LPXTG-motif cell wall-anchored protein